jgi:hypothetical protein
MMARFDGIPQLSMEDPLLTADAMFASDGVVVEKGGLIRRVIFPRSFIGLEIESQFGPLWIRARAIEGIGGSQIVERLILLSDRAQGRPR